MAWDHSVGLRPGSKATAGVEGPSALGGGRGGAAGAKAGLVVDAAGGFGGRGGAVAVGAQGVQGVVGEEAAPDQVPKRVERLAGVAAAGAFVELLEEGGAVELEIGEDLSFAFGGRRFGLRGRPTHRRRRVQWGLLGRRNGGPVLPLRARKASRAGSSRRWARAGGVSR